RALLRLLISKETELRRKYDVRWRLTGVASRRIGWVANADGLNPIATLGGHFPSAVPTARNVREWIELAKADVLFEASSLDSQTGQPAIDHIVAALEYGAHAISANKGPIVFAYRELLALAKEKGRRFLFESTVMDGVPIFSLFPLGLPLTELRGFSGVLRAQAIGIAETDPSHDMDGWDSAIKVATLATVLMGVPTRIDQVLRIGIR